MGFTRVQHGPKVGVYYHDLFLRDNPTLCLKIRSLRGKEGKMKKNISRKQAQIAHSISRQPLNKYENAKDDCADQVPTRQEDYQVVRKDFNEMMNKNVAQSNFFSANESKAFCGDSSKNSAEDMFRSLMNNSCP